MSSTSIPSVNETVPLHMKPNVCLSNDEITHIDSNIMDVYEYLIYENVRMGNNKWYSLKSQTNPCRGLFSDYNLKSNKIKK